MEQPIGMYSAGLETFQAKPMRVLVVEDSILQRRILSTSLKKWGFEVFEADSGLAALDICKKTPPDLVISDWMMPGMDGTEFCQAFRAMDREGYGYFILLTSKSDKGEVAEGLDFGADDFVSKPVNLNELRARISAGERIISMERQLQRQNKVIGDTLAELTELHDVIDRDLQQARQIQHSLLPARETILSGSRISSGLKSCGHVGGDLVGMFDAGRDQIGMYNIDVSGHGITSALMTARISGYLSDRFLDQNVALLRDDERKLSIREPADVATILNERLLAENGIDQYFTMAFASVDLNTGRAKITQAGHPEPVVIRASGDIEFLGGGGFPIGLIEGAQFDQFETHLSKGDRLLFCSDGITEATLKDGSVLEQNGLRRLLQDQMDFAGIRFLDTIYFHLKNQLSNGQVLADDISAIMLEYQPSEP